MCRQALHQDAGLNQQLISSGSTVSQLYDQVRALTKRHAFGVRVQLPIHSIALTSAAFFPYHNI